MLDTNIIRKQGLLGSTQRRLVARIYTAGDKVVLFLYVLARYSRTSDRGIHYSHSSDTRGLEGSLSTVDRLYRRHAHDIEWSCGASRRPWQNGMLWVDNCQSREEFEHLLGSLYASKLQPTAGEAGQ